MSETGKRWRGANMAPARPELVLMDGYRYWVPGSRFPCTYDRCIDLRPVT